MFYKSKFLTYFFIGVTVIQGFIFVETAPDLIPIIVGLLSTVANFMFRDLELRILIITATILMIGNAIILGSVPAMIFESMNLIILGTTIFKMNKTKTTPLSFKLSFNN